jgi:hypothetical protein
MRRNVCKVVLQEFTISLLLPIGRQLHWLAIAESNRAQETKRRAAEKCYKSLTQSDL